MMRVSKELAEDSNEHDRHGCLAWSLPEAAGLPRLRMDVRTYRELAMNREELKARTESLRKLPIRAIVAIAVRACQRMRPDFDLPGNIPDRGKHMAAVSNAIRTAVRFVEGDESFGEEVIGIANASMNAAGEAPENMLGIPATEAGFTADLVHTALHGNKDLILPRACHVIPTPPFTGGAEAKADYEKLLALNLGAFPDLGPAIDLSEKGPLGPLNAG